LLLRWLLYSLFYAIPSIWWKHAKIFGFKSRRGVGGLRGGGSGARQRDEENTCKQGDPIGRSFAHRVIVDFRHFFKKFRDAAQIFTLLFFRGDCYALNLAKCDSGCISGDFFHKLIWSPCLREDNSRALDNFFPLSAEIRKPISCLFIKRELGPHFDGGGDKNLELR
jgi:hypothetical protein